MSGDDARGIDPRLAWTAVLAAVAVAVIAFVLLTRQEPITGEPDLRSESEGLATDVQVRPVVGRDIVPTRDTP